ncbi:ABC transporter permease [Marmoricola sp. RAF53]|uniref:ABC transporter permease n=1 Tax=Marmoricola sp. RAF53 TaxID=3233059 RepID=UPI003F951201
MRAANKAEKKVEIDERGRRKNAAKRARALAEKKADSMPVVAPIDGPKAERVVDADLVSPSPRGGIIEVLQQRYLLRLIVGRELAQLYAASVLGLMWSYIQPALRFTIYYFVFGVVIHAHGNIQYFAIHLFCGIVFVHYFSETWAGGTRSIWTNRNMVLKMRVPREIFPVASMVVAFYHTGPQILVLVIACILAGWALTPGAIAAGILGTLILVTFAMSMALIFAALNVYYRDFQNIVATVTQFLHFMVPMMYPFALVYELRDSHPVAYQLYMANPLAEAVLLMQRFFWAPTTDNQAEVLKTEFPPDLWERGLIMLVLCFGLLYLAQKFFARLEGKFPERL